MGEWQPIETAPKDGRPLILRIEGYSDMVDFYGGKTAKFNRKTRKREGITEGWGWMTYGPNAANWRCVEVPNLMPLSPEVTPTHWKAPA